MGTMRVRTSESQSVRAPGRYMTLSILQGSSHVCSMIEHHHEFQMSNLPQQLNFETNLLTTPSNYMIIIVTTVTNYQSSKFLNYGTFLKWI